MQLQPFVHSKWIGCSCGFVILALLATTLLLQIRLGVNKISQRYLAVRFYFAETKMC